MGGSTSISSGGGSAAPVDIDPADAAEFRTRLAEVFRDLLAEFNARPTADHREKLDGLLDACNVADDDRMTLLFGGSVSKHTYVDGISDVDCLVDVRDSSLLDKSPREILDYLAGRIRASLSDAEVSVGAMAITVNYADGTKIQLVPALRLADGTAKVPTWNQNEWSRIKPRAFADALTRANARCGNQLVPCIKLAKAIVAGWPDEHRISGYHMESLAIEAFRGYDGPTTPDAMLPHLFSRASNLVLGPIVDKSGQSRHVDDYLGGPGSQRRQDLSHLLESAARRMLASSISGSLGTWRDMFDT